MHAGIEALVWLGFAVFWVVALVVGILLMRLATRTRQRPELYIGIGVLGIGPVGFGLDVLASVAFVEPGVAKSLAAAGAMLAIGSGAFAKLLFNARVYHPESRLVRLACWSGGLTLLLAFFRTLANDFADYGQLTPPMLASRAVLIGALLWGSGEALLYWRDMRKRLRLGLADAVVTNRFLLWGASAGAAGLGCAISTGFQWATGVLPHAVGWVLACSSAHGLVAAIGMWLAFAPPAAYTRRIAAQACQAAPPS